MRLYTLYVDDSRALRPKRPSENLVWGGFIVEKSTEESLLQNFFKLKAQFKLSPYDSVKFSPPKDPRYKPQRDIEDGNSFRSKMVRLIADSDVTLMGAYYAKERSKDLDFTKMGFQLINDLSTRLQFFLQEKSSGQNKARGCIVLAYPGPKEPRGFSEKYYKIRSNRASLQEKMVELKLLDYSLCFSFEADNPLMQIADYVVGSIACAIKEKDDTYFKVMRPRFRHKKGNIKGYGLIAYPHYTTEIDRLCEISKD